MRRMYILVGLFEFLRDLKCNFVLGYSCLRFLIRVVCSILCVKVGVMILMFIFVMVKDFG